MNINKVLFDIIKWLSKELKNLFYGFLLVLGIILLIIGYISYSRINVKFLKPSTNKFYISVSDTVDIKSLKFYLRNTKARQDEKLIAYVELEIQGNFEYLSMQLPWKINPAYASSNAKFGEESFSVDSTGNMLIYGETGKNVFKHTFVIEVLPNYNRRYSETTFEFPISTMFSDGMPYSLTRNFMPKIIEPKIDYFEFILSSDKYKTISYATPQPDAMVEIDNSFEARWWFNPDKNKYMSSISISFVDKDKQRKESEIAFNSGIYLSLGFSILLSLFLGVIDQIRKRHSC